VTVAPPEPDALERSFPRAAKVLRLVLATLLSVWFGAIGSWYMQAEALAMTEERMERFSRERIVFVVAMAAFPLAFGAAAARASHPHSPRVPAAVTTLAVLVIGILAHRADPDFQSFLYLSVTAPAFLLGVALRQRFRRRSPARRP
jgi:hypothetical protein